jgi:hypothetical protein
VNAYFSPAASALPASMRAELEKLFGGGDRLALTEDTPDPTAPATGSGGSSSSGPAPDAAKADDTAAPTASAPTTTQPSAGPAQPGAAPAPKSAGASQAPDLPLPPNPDPNGKKPGYMTRMPLVNQDEFEQIGKDSLNNVDQSGNSKVRDVERYWKQIAATSDAFRGALPAREMTILQNARQALFGLRDKGVELKKLQSLSHGAKGKAKTDAEQKLVVLRQEVADLEKLQAANPLDKAFGPWIAELHRDSTNAANLNKSDAEWQKKLDGGRALLGSMNPSDLSAFAIKNGIEPQLREDNMKDPAPPGAKPKEVMNHEVAAMLARYGFSPSNFGDNQHFDHVETYHDVRDLYRFENVGAPISPEQKYQPAPDATPTATTPAVQPGSPSPGAVPSP